MSLGEFAIALAPTTPWRYDDPINGSDPNGQAATLPLVMGVNLSDRAQE